ncbi:AraC family transcriptional regulator [Neoroseomonas soli]|uniref:AraC family transcriptional regulator n=1 Tax=Neoroseomonas soli TaxID=1081025 RepID=A0A9X9WTR6_9PROT|nr:AraC family transcriptional regulator [Neoroseomonas soli]MBR0670545.1 AraC family transcriptional regulator [Neoroseomonas soli]
MTVMAAPADTSQAMGLTRRFNEAGAFASALLGGQFDCLPVRQQPFAATLRVLRVGEMVVQQATTAAHVTRGGIAPGIAVLMMNLEAPQRPARVNGAEVGTAEAILALGGAEITSNNPRCLDWAALALPLPQLEELAELAPPQMRVRGTVSLLALLPERAARLAGSLSASRQLADDPSVLLDSPDAAGSLAMSLREEVAAALTAEAEFRPRPRAVGQALRIVAAAEAFMEAQVERPVYTEELCTALGVSARRLHDAFRAALGMSPHAYLKSRRLMLVHRALLGQLDTPDLVKSVALAHGFWHLGHFARDYRALFGRLPSETLARRATSGGGQARPLSRGMPAM